MKNRIFLMSAFLGLFAIFAVTANAQKVGGYKPIAADDAGAQAAAEFAVGAESEKTGKTIELVSIHTAERQTVQGANYRLCMKVSSEGGEGQDDVSFFVQVVVYQDLKRAYKLTSWATSECGDD